MKHIFVLSVLIIALSFSALAQAIDPESMIKKEGYESKGTGDDGKTIFYSLGKTMSALTIKVLENEVARLPKNTEIFAACDLLRGGLKAKLIESSGVAYDVAVSNYGYDGPTIVCVLKFMRGNSVGTQIRYSKEGHGGVYTVYIKS